MINNWKKFLAIFMCVSMVANVFSFVGEVKAVDNKWTKYTGNTNFSNGSVTEDATGVTLETTAAASRAAAYYTEKVTVQEGTKISMDVEFPKFVSTANLQYAFGITADANSFYTQDGTKKNTVVTEFTSLGTGTNVMVNGSIIKPGDTNRTTLVANAGITTTKANITTTKYNVTFEKQAATSNNSWVITVKELKDGGNTITMSIPSQSVSHDLFANGAYIIAGTLNGTLNVTKVSNVVVTQPEDDNPDEPTTKWTKYTGNTNFTNGSVTEDATGVTLETTAAASRAAAYYTEKVTVQAGTKISMDVEFPEVVSTANLQYAFGITTDANSFYTQSGTKKNTVVAEFTSLGTGTNVMVNGSIIKPGDTNRTTLVANAGITAAKADITTTKYNVTFEKQEATSNNSWVITAKELKDGGNTITMSIPAQSVAHNLFADGAYIIAGTLNGTLNATKVSNVVVTQPGDEPIVPNPPVDPDEPDEPEDENGAWKVIDSMTASGTLTEDQSYNGDARFENKVAAYYKEKITVEEDTYISFKTTFPVIADGEVLHYGFSLTNTPGCFYTSNNSASSVSAELQSSTNNNWQMASIASKKIAPATNRTFLANIGVLATKRSTTDVFEITMKKIDKTVGDVNYSWEITTKNLATGTVASYRVKSTDVAHNLFDNGAYFAVGVMNGNGYTMEISDLTVGVAVPVPETAWEAVRGYDGADFTTSSNEAVTLIGGKGGAYRKEAFNLINNTSISLQYEAKALTQRNSNDFYIMWLDKPSLVNGAGDAGNGYALQMRTSGDYSSFTLFLREVSKGKMGTDTTDASLKIGGGAINASALNQKIEVKFTRRTQKLDGVQYYGSVTVTVAGKSYTKQITMEDAKRVFGNLDKDLYLMAGNMNNIVNTFEVKNVKVAPLPFIQSIAGLWKQLYGYSLEELGAIVNKQNSVELHGQGAAYLSQATSSNPINLSFTMTDLTNDYHNKFSFAVLNQSGSFVNDGKSKGTGFVVEFRSFDQFDKGYAVYVATVTDGKASDYEKLSERIVLGDMTKSKFDIRLERKSNGAWEIKVVDQTYSQTLSYTLSNCDALQALTPGNVHLSAGNAGIDMKATIGY